MSRALSPTSFIVLGLLRDTGPCSPYDLKIRIAGSLGNFWTVAHSHLYAEPDRLVEDGLAGVEREPGGRRRKTYAITPAGEAELDAWLATPRPALAEIRNPALLQVFFGADPAAVARAQLPLHEAKLAEYEALAAAAADTPPGSPTGPRVALEAGLRTEREWVRYWRELRDGT